MITLKVTIITMFVVEIKSPPIEVNTGKKLILACQLKKLNPNKPKKIKNTQKLNI